MGKAEFEKALHMLTGIIEGIQSDNEFEYTYPFKEVIPLIKTSISDGIITAEEIEDIHWRFSNGVTKETDDLIVGDGGNPCWAFACYGRK